MSNKNIDEMERDMKGYPDLKEEQAYNDKQDFEYEVALEKAKNEIDFNDILQVREAYITNIIEEYNQSIEELLDGYHQTIINQFKLKDIK